MSSSRRAELFGSLSKSRSRKRSKSRGKKRDRSRSRRRSRSRKRQGRSRKRDRDRDKEKDRDRSCSRDDSRDKKKSRSREGDSEKEKDRGKDRDKKKDRDKDRNKDRSRSRGDDRDQDKREKDKDKKRDKDKEKDRDRDRDREKKDKDRDKDRNKERDNNRDGDSDKDNGKAQRDGGTDDEAASRGVQVAPPGTQAAPAPERKQAATADPDDEVHFGIACGNCQMFPLVGDRFKCSVCESYDLCETCYEMKAQVHVPTHRFFVQKAVVARKAVDAPPPEALPPPSEPPPPPPPPSMASEVADPARSPQAPHLQPTGPGDPLATAMHMQQPQAPPPQPTGPGDPHATAMQMQQMMEQMHAMVQQSTQQVAPSAPVDYAPPPPFPPAPVAEQPSQPPPPTDDLQASQAAMEMPAWLPAHIPCQLCQSTPTDDKPHGVICFRVRGKSKAGCCQGVCWSCMETRPRAQVGMVRTTRAEFVSLEDDAWWMHETCMEKADLREYYGGEKELAAARAAADAEDNGKVAEAKDDEKAQVAVDPMEAEKVRIRAMSVKDLKAYLERHGVDHAQFLEKADMVAAALAAADKSGPEGPVGPAWMPPGMVCRLCTKPVKQEYAGVVCTRKRPDGTIGGCGEGVCWRCMKRAPKDSFGHVRRTKEEFESLGDVAWWMHTACFGPGDHQSYFNEPEPAGFKNTQKALRRRRGEDVSEDEWE